MELIMAIAAICQMHTGGEYNASHLAIKQQRQCQAYYAKCVNDKPYLSITGKVITKKILDCMVKSGKN